MNQFRQFPNLINLSPYSSDEAVDIYLFPDGPSTINGGGGGEAWGIGDRTALAVGGTSTHLPESPVLYSHLFSHEMGHILGLLHTHQDASGGSHLSTGDELVDQVNNPDQCLFSGDCICDTPAEFN